MESFSVIPWFYRNSRQLFWMLQILGWIVFGIAEFSIRAVLESSSNLAIAAESSKHAFVGMIISLLLKVLFSYLWKHDLVVRLLTAIMGIIICALLWNFLVVSTDLTTLSSWKHMPYFWLAVGVLIYSYWAFLYHIIKYYQISMGHRQIFFFNK